MSSIRPMVPKDLLNFYNVNIGDEFVTTFNTSFYLEYLAKWPQYCHVIYGRDEEIEGYIIGKSETSPPGCPPTNFDGTPNINYLPWHAHITALAIAPDYRRLGHARKLTQLFENVANRENTWFVDLFVRSDNAKALRLYESMGREICELLLTETRYKPYRKVLGYYQDGKDAFDMRKAMKREGSEKHIKDEPFEVDPSLVW